MNNNYDLERKISEQDQKITTAYQSLLDIRQEMTKMQGQIDGIGSSEDITNESLKDALRATSSILNYGRLYSVDPDTSMVCATYVMLSLLNKNAEAPKDLADILKSAHKTVLSGDPS